jgi:hypothetical protein
MKHLLTILAAALAFIAFAAEANADWIRGRLTILNNQFILKLPEPFEHDDSVKQDGSYIVTASEIHVQCTKERRAELRALVGKDVKIRAAVEGADTQQDCAPLVLIFDENTEPFQEVDPAEAEEGNNAEASLP